MTARVRFRTAGICFAVVALAAAHPVRAVDSLPMPAKHYAELCRQSGGVITLGLNGAFGTAQCLWPNEGKTACKVSADEVNACAILCESPACLKANPDRFNPSWPLAGGPQSAAVQTGTQAPAN
jgi:hypothetical protein